MARFLFITNKFAEPLEEDQYLVILTKMMDLAEYHVLRRKNYTLKWVVEFLTYSGKAPISFKGYLTRYPNNKAIIVHENQSDPDIPEIIKASKRNDIVLILAPRWQDMILEGALAKAATMTNDEIKQKLDVADFTIGFQFSCGNIKETLIPVGRSLPCHFTQKVTVPGAKGMVIE